MRNLTLDTMVRSAMSIIEGDVDEFAITGDMLQKGSAKFIGLGKIQDDSFLPDDLRRQALLLDHAPEAGVACTTVFFLDSGELARMETRDREGQRGNGVVS
jgi:hypothetical protein